VDLAAGPAQHHSRLSSNVFNSRQLASYKKKLHRHREECRTEKTVGIGTSQFVKGKGKCIYIAPLL